MDKWDIIKKDWHEIYILEYEALVLENCFLPAEDLLPHEKVIQERKEGLVNYLQTNYEEVIIPSIIICSNSNVIIDGHHRFRALMDLGYTTIPVTKINYSDPKILTHSNPEFMLSKEKIISAGQQRKLLDPKSSIHRLAHYSSISVPIILLSKLSLILK